MNINSVFLSGFISDTPKVKTREKRGTGEYITVLNLRIRNKFIPQGSARQFDAYFQCEMYGHEAAKIFPLLKEGFWVSIKGSLFANFSNRKFNCPLCEYEEAKREVRHFVVIDTLECPDIDAPEKKKKETKKKEKEDFDL